MERTFKFAMYTLYKSLDDGKALTLMSYTEDEASISHMYANIYKIASIHQPEANIIKNEEQREFYAIKINDDNTASLIMHEYSPNGLLRTAMQLSPLSPMKALTPTGSC